MLFVGDKGMLLSDYGKHVLLPEKEFADFKRPEPFIPKSLGHHAEWIHACKTGEPTTCNFEYAGWLTEANHLGNVAYRAGKKLEWDAAKLNATNAPEADAVHPPRVPQGLDAGLTEEEEAPYARVAAVLKDTVRAKPGAVECMNSVLRMQQSRHRRMTRPMLDLKRLYWNCRRFRSGPQGRPPLLGAGPGVADIRPVGAAPINANSWRKDRQLQELLRETVPAPPTIWPAWPGTWNAASTAGDREALPRASIGPGARRPAASTGAAAPIGMICPASGSRTRERGSSPSPPSRPSRSRRMSVRSSSRSIVARKRRLACPAFRPRRPGGRGGAIISAVIAGHGGTPVVRTDLMPDGSSRSSSSDA